MAGTFIINNPRKNVKKNNFNLRKLRLSLKYRPEILKLILKMKECIKKKNILLKKLKHNLKAMKVKLQNRTTSNINQVQSESLACSINSKEKRIETKDAQTETVDSSSNCEVVAWGGDNDGEGGKSIADQVKEVAQNALQQTGMVYVETAGMYYDYKTGYYYNSELGLYYHTDTSCYYTFSEEKQAFEFHSYPDRRVLAKSAALEAHEKKKARKHKKEKEDEEKEASKPKRKKKDRKKQTKNKENKDLQNDKDSKKEEVINLTEKDEDKDTKGELVEDEEGVGDLELEDGECSETGSEKSDGEASDTSTDTASDEESIAKHLPPCMRVIVRETDLPKLKVGSLFLVTKDGGTVGREGEQHTILIKDTNVSRNHLDIKYDLNKRIYTATDLGSKNGTVLNGVRMSESQLTSEAMEIPHGSTIQLGETRLLCHIHRGNDTCGHCEPGLIMDHQEKEKKVAYTRTCSVQKQHQLELARLKNKYAPKVLAIEETAYNDRAQQRRETVGSSHSSEKTLVADLETSIAPENKGFKLLEKMGWSKGEGLGKDSQGDVEPIPIVSNEGKAGLGTAGAVAPPPLVPTKPKKPTNTLGQATLRLANRTKMLQPPAKAFMDPIDDDSE